MIPEREFISHVDPASFRLRRLVEHGQDRFYLYTPKWGHVILLVALWVVVAFTLVPAAVLSKAAVFQLAILVAVPNAILAAWMLAQAMARASVDERIDGRYYWLTHDKLEIPAFTMAAVAACFSGLALALAVMGYHGCSNARGNNNDLATLVFNMACDVAPSSAAIDFTTLLRLPGFSSDLAWLQACLDDRLVSMAFMVVASVAIVLDVAAAVYQSQLKGWTVDLNLRLNADVGTGGRHDDTELQEEEEEEEERVVYRTGPFDPALEQRPRTER